jgi:hypothetical protein
VIVGGLLSVESLKVSIEPNLFRDVRNVAIKRVLIALLKIAFLMVGR